MAEQDPQQLTLPIMSGLRDVAQSHSAGTAALSENINRGLGNVVGSVMDLKNSFLNLSSRQMNQLEDQIVSQSEYFERSIEQQQRAASGPLQMLQTLFGYMTQTQAGKIAATEEKLYESEKNRVEQGQTILQLNTQIMDVQKELVDKLVPSLNAMNLIARERTIQSSKSRQDEIIKTAEQEGVLDNARDYWRSAKLFFNHAQRGDEAAQEMLDYMRQEQPLFMRAMESLQNAITRVKEAAPLPGENVSTLAGIDQQQEQGELVNAIDRNTQAVNQNTNVEKQSTAVEEEVERRQKSLFGEKGALAKAIKDFKDLQGARDGGPFSVGMLGGIASFGRIFARLAPIALASVIAYRGDKEIEAGTEKRMAEGYSKEEADRLAKAGSSNYGTLFGATAGAVAGTAILGPGFGTWLGTAVGGAIGNAFTGPDSLAERLEKWQIDLAKSNQKNVDAESALVDQKAKMQEEEQGFWRSLLSFLGFDKALDQVDKTNDPTYKANVQKRKDAELEKAIAAQKALIANPDYDGPDWMNSEEDKKRWLERETKKLKQMEASRRQPSSLEMTKKKEGALLNEKGAPDNKPIVVPVPAGGGGGTTVNNTTNNNTTVKMGTDPNFKGKVQPNNWGRIQADIF